MTVEQAREIVRGAIREGVLTLEGEKQETRNGYKCQCCLRKEHHFVVYTMLQFGETVRVRYCLECVNG